MTSVQESQYSEQANTSSRGATPPTHERSSPVRSSRRGRTGGLSFVRLLPVLFAAVMVAAVGMGLWQVANPPRSGDAPPSIGGYGLGEIVTGPQAVAQMSRLHGKDVGVVDGYVAHYQGPKGGIVAYVASTASEKGATDLLRLMEQRIGGGNQYFTNLKPIDVGGVRVLSVRSGQEAHYFWATGVKVIWLAFDRDDQVALSQAVQTMR